MKIISDIKEIQMLLEQLRIKKKIISFVPTMGALHKGHLSLIEIAKKKSDVIIASIFINPTQFSQSEDFSKYPRQLNKDIKLLQKKCDVLFIPSIEKIYPKNFATYVEVENMSSILEGKIRPTHFKGVATVVIKLFNIINPHIAIFGQKDAQQVAIIKKIVNDLNFNVEIIVGKTIREKDGLAISSRNVYLTTEERKNATILFKSLQYAKHLIKLGETNSQKIIFKMKSLIQKNSKSHIQYIAITDLENLSEKEFIKKNEKILISLAIKFTSARLIDNVIVKAN